MPMGGDGRVNFVTCPGTWQILNQALTESKIHYWQESDSEADGYLMTVLAAVLCEGCSVAFSRLNNDKEWRRLSHLCKVDFKAGVLGGGRGEFTCNFVDPFAGIIVA
jgi:hypothetical protein